MKTWNVKEYGVLPDTRILQTDVIQKVIDLCHENGGGEVIIPAGQYYVGSLRLYSHITLHLLENAQLYGSRNYLDYTDFHVPTTLGYVTDPHYIKLWNLPEYYIYGIICAYQQENISIVGEKGSQINGQDCFDEHGEEGFRGPMGIIFSQCRDITLKGYTFINSANWSHQLDSCRDVLIENVNVFAGHDGFDLHHCSNIKISNCHLETGDDCLAGYNMEHLYVDHSYMNTACNVMRIGGSDIVLDQCTFEGPGHYPHLSEKTYYTHSLLKYYAISADRIEKEGDILIKNSKVEGIPVLLSYQYGSEKLMHCQMPLRSLIFENVEITGLSKCSYFKGNGEKCILEFRNCILPGNFSDFLEIDDSIQLHI